MMRLSASGAAARALGSIARATISKINDKPKAREIDLELLKDEQKYAVEHFETYGLTATPKAPDSSGKAEAIVAFLGGARSHAVVLATTDRRFRPKDRQEGEVTLHDDQGQELYISRDGIKISGSASKKPVTVTVGNSTLTIADGTITAQVGSMKIILSASRVDLGGPNGSAVETVDGPSSKVFAVR